MTAGTALTPAERRVARVIGGQIEKIRTARHLTRADLATTIGVTERAVQSWETGTRLPHVKRLYDLAGALGTSARYFLP